MKDNRIVNELVSKTSDIALKDFPMTTRLYHCLKRSGYVTLSDIIVENPDKFLKIRNFGKACEQELVSIIQFISNSSREDIISFCYGEETIGTNSYMPVLAADSSKVDYKECTILEYVMGKKLDKNDILFLDDNGGLCEDIFINEMCFSLRTCNRLLAYGVSSMKQVASLKYLKLMRIGGLGKKGIGEIIDGIERRIVICDVDVANNEDRVQDVVRRVIDYYSAVIDETVILAKKPEITNAVTFFLKRCEMDSVDSASFMLEMSKIDPIKTLLRRTIMGFLSGKIYNGVDQVALIALASRSISYFEPIFRIVLADLVETGQVRIVASKVNVYKLFLDEWIDKLEGNFRVAIDGRCKGLTLEEIGKQIGITRERVRQLIHTALKRRPELYEDDYAAFIEKYGFKPEEFCELLSLNSYQLNYLLLIHKTGVEDIQSFFHDNMVPSFFKERVPRVFKRKVIILDGECIPLKREELLKKLLKIFCSNNECSVEEFETFYQTFLREKDLESQEALAFPSSRAFEARITDCSYSLMKSGRKIRYYDTEAVDIDCLMESLDIRRYNNMEISTLKLIRDWPAVMEQYDIRDEYELHNLLRKRIADVSKYAISVTRMPFITIGEGDRVNQVEELLIQMAPVTNVELAKTYEEVYGVRTETVLANFFRPIDIYYHNGLFDLEKQDLDEGEYDLLRSTLTEDVYLWDEITKKYREITKQSKADAINAMTLKKLGFKVYSRYVISSKYPSAEAFFTTVLLQDRCIDLNQFKQGIRSIKSFHATLSGLRDELELVEVGKEVYYRFDLFAEKYSVNSKTELHRMGQEVLSRIEDPEYFSVDAIAKSSLLEDMPSIRDNIYILNSIIRIQNGYKINRIANAYIATRKENDLSLSGLFTHITKAQGGISVWELLNTLRNDYKINLDKSRVVYILQESKTLIYDDIFDNISFSLKYHDVTGPVYLNESCFASAIAEKQTEINRSQAAIAKYYWDDKYAGFVEYCGMNGYFLMRDILKLNFRELSDNACKLNISKGTIADIVEIYMEWVRKFSSTEENVSSNESIMDLFFK